MALISPGVDVSIINESQYTSAATNTVPYILIATAEDKLDPSSTGVAPGTTAAAANDIYLITSQRELSNTFGNATFHKTSAGDAIHGHELNEYGLNAAYSVLGATNRAYIQRVNIDLGQLAATLVRPTGEPNDNATWFDLAETTPGLFVWDSVQNTFDVVVPIVITDVADLDAGAPAASIGAINSYAIVATNTNNPIYYKGTDNVWSLIGSDKWKSVTPAVVGTASDPLLTVSDDIVINGTTVTNTGTTIDTLVTAITTAAITGVTAAKVNGRIEFYIETGVGAIDDSADVTITLANGIQGDLIGDLGIPVGSQVGPTYSFAGPIVAQESHINIPRWRTTDTTPRPSGSVWHKMTSVNSGLGIVLKSYDATSGTWISQPVPAYYNDQAANKILDPATGGKSIPTGATYVQIDVLENDTGTFKIFERVAGLTAITGTVVTPTFSGTEEFTISVSVAGSDTLTTPATIAVTGTTVAAFLAAFNGAAIPGVLAEVNANGRIKISHLGGGVIVLEDTTGGAIAATGITDALENVRVNTAGQLVLSNWNVLDYTASFVEPGQDPLNGTRWYYSDINDIDIMMHDGGGWYGYQNVTNDVRGFDLSVTNPTGPMVSPTAPTTQSDGTALVYGDLWVDTSDLEQYPNLRRWEDVDGLAQWVLIASDDQTSGDGILFADARWALNETTDPVTDDLPSTVDLLTSDYADIDIADPDLYPDGMLLWNTRRSGYNVKEFRVNYFNSADFGAAVIPTETNAWVSVSGNRDDGSAYFGRQAQRALVVKAMKATIDTSQDAREEQRLFGLIAAPGYPELIPNMVALNNERTNTAFIVGDSPLRLPNTGAALTEWATNNGGLGTQTSDGLVSSDEYLGVFYPSGQTTDFEGTPIVVPASHMILRTILHSDEQSYPWIAPAGTRRGGVDNADAIGYINAATGEFVQIATRQGVRDVLYSNSVNPIAVMPGAGIVNFGNLTTAPGTAMDRVNVSRLVSYIRIQLDQIGKQFVFEPNDKITRDEIKGRVERMLNDIVAKRGVYAYVVICDESNNTASRIDRNELILDVGIEPVKSAEFILIPVRIRSTGTL